MAREEQRRATRERLIQSAVQLLSRKWLSEVSVADICRTAGMSNGVYYRYFSSKEEIFLDILERYFNVLSEALLPLQESRGQAGIEKFCQVVFDLTDQHQDLTLIFREGQYRFYDYERRINQLYEKVITAILQRTPSTGELIFIMAGTRFTAFRRTYHGLSAEPEKVAALLWEGIFPCAEPDWSKVLDIEVKPLPLKLERPTPDKLVQAGKELLGKTGYHDMNIYRLTNAAGFGVGTFYNYFQSKEQFMEVVISTISHQIRQFISSNLSTGLSRLEIELQGMVLFAFYISNVDPSCYNIVREAEFVTPDAVRAYYDDFSKGYSSQQASFRNDDPWLAGNVLIGLSHYFGLAVLHDPSGYQEASRKILKETSRLLCEGLHIT